MSEKHYRQIRTARANNVTGTIFRTLRYITREKKGKILLAITIICIVISSITGVVNSYFFTPIINNYVVPYIGQSDPDMSGFIRMLGVMAFVYTSGVLASYTYKRLMSILSTGMLNDLRQDLFKKMQKMAVSFYDTHTNGELMIFYTNDIDTMRPMVAETMPQLINAFVKIGRAHV